MVDILYFLKSFLYIKKTTLHYSAFKNENLTKFNNWFKRKISNTENVVLKENRF